MKHFSLFVSIFRQEVLSNVTQYLGPRIVTFGAKLAPQVLTAQGSPQSPCCTLLLPDLSNDWLRVTFVLLC